MSLTDSSAFLDVALDCVVDAADWIAHSKEPEWVRQKPDTSLITRADTAIQRRIAGRVSEAFPDHAVVGEEHLTRPPTHARRSDARFCWVIDPVDGTRNYAAGFPCFSTSIAVLEHGVPIVGVVREHNTGLTYSAVAGAGARCSGKAIRVRTERLGGDRMVAFPSSKDDLTIHIARVWCARPGLVARNVGSTAVHLALLASGALEAVFARRCKVWDIAAGALLVTEAGGVATALDGSPLFPWPDDADPSANMPILAGCAPLHRELLDDFRAAATG